MKQCVQCLVTGKVQGVWFRGATQQLALRLGLTGYAKNLSDGRVEVVVCGEDEGIRQLCEWLRQGPPAAQVTDVSCTAYGGGEFSHFTTA